MSNFNNILTNYKRRSEGFTLSASRRIERVAPVGERVVAMVFEDEPTRFGDGGTEQSLALLREYGAKATFGVFGSTAENYPDTSGERGGACANGRRYDHFADFGLDDLSGAEACAETARRIDREGHELANHSYRHIMLGKSKTYRGRETFSGFDGALADVKRQHELILKLTKFEMRLFSPPRGVVALSDGKSAFDLCEAMGYHLLTAGADDGGEPELSVLRDILDGDATALAGTIVTVPHTADALQTRLELLERRGYRVVTVSRLLYNSPFEDVRPADDCFEAVRDLDRAGFTLGFRSNRFYPDRSVSKAELAVIFSLPGGARPRPLKIDRGDAAPVRLVSAAAAETFETTSGQPRSNSRGDVAVWLREQAGRNGIL